MMRLSVRLKHGDPDETERMFDEAMEQKLTAIEQMKAYLSRRG
jgi:pentatricopeptide repeat protein